MSKKNTYVTQPFLPPLEEMMPYLETIWSTKILTNGGPYHQQLEEELCKYLGVNYISLFNNGTIALITALQALNISGEVITTPYSFVATSNSLLWNNIKPVFVDIDPKTLNLDPKKIESAITDKTTAILPVHCYGSACDVDEIERIATKNNLKVIYDAAHAFGVNCHCGSVLNHGDLSILSFHATKVFNTFEGGAIICKDSAMKNHIDNLKNFGFVNETTVIESGINGKMSELNAAIGLAQLKHMPYALAARKKVALKYNHTLKNISGITIAEINLIENTNYSYYPILINDSFSISRDELYEALKKKNIFTRRYFYPLISDFSMYSSFDSAAASNLPIAKKIANQILCLPIYPDLDQNIQSEIVSTIKSI
jgi:dTDP-4-amino-4,6-dideoxygalactose transaminase